MDKQSLIRELENIIGPYLKEQGFVLVELSAHYEAGRLVLKIIADRPEGGVTLGECSLLNQRLGEILDQEDFLKEEYLLEVSSPGIDRPIRTKEDFSRCINRQLRFFLSQPLEGKLEVAGRLLGIKDELLSVEAKGTVIEIPLNKINLAKQQV